MTSHQDSFQDKYIRSVQLKGITGLSRASICRLERTGLFPRRRQIYPGTADVMRKLEEDPWVAAVLGCCEVKGKFRRQVWQVKQRVSSLNIRTWVSLLNLLKLLRRSQT